MMTLNRIAFVAVTLLCSTQLLDAAALVKRETPEHALEHAPEHATEHAPEHTSEHTPGEILLPVAKAAHDAAAEAVHNGPHAIGLDNLHQSLPTVEVFTEQLHNQTLGFASFLGNSVTELQTEASSHQGNLQTVLEQTATKWDEAANALNSTDVTKSAHEVQQQLQHNVNSLQDSYNNIVKELPDSEAHGNVANLLSQFKTKLEEYQHAFTISAQSGSATR